MNIHLSGVGGQGIGLLSEVMLRAIDYAGLTVKGVDTHGLAQRGGITVSQIRVGDDCHSPMVPVGTADLVVALERHEALRGMQQQLQEGGTLAYYDTVWQPLEVRMQKGAEVTADDVATACAARNIKVVVARNTELADVRMQNVILLGQIARWELVPGVKPEHYRQAMEDLLPGSVLSTNLELFDSELVAAPD